MYYIYNYVLDDYPHLYGHSFHHATFDFNCHSYAWYSQNYLTNKRWIDYPDSYILDYSYEEVTDVRPGDIYCYWAYALMYDENNQPFYGYFISHSAIVVDFTDDFDLFDEDTYQYITLISKWSYADVFEHAANYCYYFTSEYGYQFAKVYRPRVSETATLSNPLTNTTTTITKTKVVPENPTIINRYALYELNVNDSLDYVFSTSSNSLTTMKLYTVHMQPLTISLNNSYVDGVYRTTFSTYLLSGTYYLRVSFQNINSYGTITTSIDCAHYHNFNSYVWRDLTFHN